MTILSSLGDEQIRIYIDEGHSPDSKTTGFEIRIIKYEDERQKDPLGSVTTSKAERTAIYEALQ